MSPLNLFWAQMGIFRRHLVFSFWGANRARGGILKRHLVFSFAGSEVAIKAVEGCGEGVFVVDIAVLCVVKGRIVT